MSPVIINNRLVKIDYIYPPIPSRQFDYQVTFDDWDLGDIVAFGPSPEAALAEFRLKLEERE